MSELQTLPVLDNERTMKMLGLGEEDIVLLLGMFREELAEWIEFFSSSEALQAEELRVRAHKLKSEAANVGAMQVHHGAIALEQAIKTDCPQSMVAQCQGELLSALVRLDGVLTQVSA